MPEAVVPQNYGDRFLDNMKSVARSQKSKYQTANTEFGNRSVFIPELLQLF